MGQTVASTSDPRHRRAQPFLMAVLASAVTVAASVVLAPMLRTFRLTMLLPAILLAAWFGGAASGLLATGLCTAAACWLVSIGSPVQPVVAGDIVALSLFALVGIAVSLLFRPAPLDEIAQRKRAERALESERTRLRRLIEEAPFAVAAYEGPHHIAVLSNAKHLEMTAGRVVIGTPLLESIPELRGQPVIAALDEVYATGVAKTVREVRAQLVREGSLEDCWFDVTWQPTHDTSGGVNGVFVSAVEVTDYVRARQTAEAAHATADRAKRLAEAITSNATLGLVVMDARQRCTFMNPAAEAIFGWTLPEVQALDRPLHEIVHHTRPDGSPYPLADCPIDRALPKGTQEQGEDALVRKDGSFYPVAFTASPLFENGIAVGTVIEVEDITERKQTQDRLRASERKFSAVFEHAAFAICLVKMPDAVIADVNPAWVELFGYTRDEVIGRTSLELGMDEDLEARRRVREEFQDRGFVRNMETKFRTKAGELLTVSNSLDSVELNGVQYVLGTYQDVTEHREAERALRESERQFRELVDNLPELAWSARSDGHIDFYNRRWYEYTGTTFEQMEGWGWKSVHDPEFLPSVLETWSRSITTGEPFEMEFPLRRSDGVFRWFLTRVRPLTDSQGRIVRWFGTNIDVEDAKRARMERERLVSQLQDALHVREEFLSVAAHELRTPVTSLLLQLQWLVRLLRSGREPSNELEPRLEVATKQTKRLAALVNELLDVSRISSGRLEMNVEEVDLIGLVAEMLDRHRHVAESAGCVVAMETNGDVRGRWDRLRLEQLMTNLLSNAIKYGPGAPIKITVARAGGDARVSVRDEGIGIGREDLGRIFDRFERAVSSQHYGGLGLGLYIAREIAEAHGGRIEVASEPGKGSTFTVWLPIEARTGAHEAAEDRDAWRRSRSV